MKKTLLLAALALGAMTANAQAIQQPGFFDNWSIGVDGGVTTPLTNNPFFKSMRAQVGLNVKKQITPTFGLGVEGQFGINTSTWKGHTYSTTAFDNSYVGTFGTVDLFNLFGGYNCQTRPFTIEAMAGAGWGHDYISHTKPNGTRQDWNYFATKAGLNFNFNVNDYLTIAVKPSVTWNMNGNKTNSVANHQSATYYDASNATFNFQVGLVYHIGGNSFDCVTPYDQAEVDALNAQINELRAALGAAMTDNAALEATAADLAAQLAACQNRKPEVIKEQVVNNNLNSVRYVFFRIGSSVITADQQPNVEMIASYLKNHKDAKVVIKGYASKDGPEDVNIKLAQARAEAVKNALIKRYKIAANRIQAEGQGIGEMFSEESWNRVSICTIEEAK